MVLPAHRAAGVAGEAFVGQARQAREAALDGDAPDGLVDHAQRLVQPDRDSRPDAADQAVRDSRLWLGQRARAGVLPGSGRPDPSSRPPKLLRSLSNLRRYLLVRYDFSQRLRSRDRKRHVPKINLG